MSSLHTRSTTRQSKDPTESSDNESERSQSDAGTQTSSRKHSRTNSRATSDTDDDHLDSEDDIDLNYDKMGYRRSDAGSQTSNRKHSRATSGTDDDHLDSEDDLDMDCRRSIMDPMLTPILDLCRVHEEHERSVTNVYRRFGQLVKTSATSSVPYIKNLFAVSSIYLFWITLHFATAQLYVKFCAYPSLYGFLLSPFLISSPHCAAMRWIFTKGGTLLDGMWIILGTWLCSKVLYRDV
jgi:hypothetical protein